MPLVAVGESYIGNEYRPHYDGRKKEEIPTKFTNILFDLDHAFPRREWTDFVATHSVAVLYQAVDQSCSLPFLRLSAVFIYFLVSCISGG